MKGGSALMSAAVILCALGAAASARQAGVQETVYSPGNGITNPTLITSAEPRYTPQALASRIQGNVEITAVIRPDGTVGDVKISRSLDSQFGLDQEALEAAKQWLFKPGMKDGRPVPVIVTLVLTFKPGPATLRSSAEPALPDAPVAADDFAADAVLAFSPRLVNPVTRSMPSPSYTDAARRAKLQGEVLVDAVVGVDGTVLRARIARSLDATYGLDDEALKAVRQWTFEPGVLDGQKVPVLVHLTVTFRLR